MEISSDFERELVARQLCEKFIHSKNLPRYILGRNDFAKSVASLIDVDGFIDEFTDEKLYLNKPIINNLNALPVNVIVLSCAVCEKPITVLNKLRKLNIQHIDYYAFLKYSGLPLKKIEFWAGFEQEYERDKELYDNLINCFADENSKDIYSKILNFRLTFDVSFMKDFEDLQYKQYFEDFLYLKEKDEVFVDIGGYDGYTTQEFIKRCPGYKRIYFFEPDKINLNLAKNNLKGNKNIEFFELGITNNKGILYFENDLGSSSRISETGSIVIETDSIDNIIQNRITFIKMDIEGSEGNAIEGAKQSILKYHPRLAICVYHKSNDLIEIPKQILAIRNDYDIFLRHYTEGVVETVMYFIPKKLK